MTRIFFGLISVIKVCNMLGRKYYIALKDCGILVLLIGSYFSNIFCNAQSVIIREYPKVLILCYGFSFAKIMGIMQLSHIKGDRFKIYNFTTLFPILSLFVHSIIHFLFGISLLSVDYYIIGFLIWNFISWAHFVYYCSEELCKILDIYRFVLKDN